MMIHPTALFKENLECLPSIDHLTRIELVDLNGAVVWSIENQPGKQGSLAVYHYLSVTFVLIDAEAAAHGLVVFAEHTEDAKNRPGAHPNIDLLLEVVNGGAALNVRPVAA